MKYGMNLKFETIVQIFRKIKQLITVIILKSSNDYHQKTISKSGHKMDLYPALGLGLSNLVHRSKEVQCEKNVMHFLDFPNDFKKKSF